MSRNAEPQSGRSTKDGSRHVVRSSLNLLSPRDRRRYRLMGAVQASLSILDLVGVFLFGFVVLLVSLTATGSPLPDPAVQALDRFALADLDPSTVTLVVGAIASALLLTKSVLAAVLVSRMNRFLAAASGRVSKELVSGFLNQPFLKVRERSTQWTTLALTNGVTAAVVTVLGAAAVSCAEGLLLGLLCLALLALDPMITILSVCYFGLAAFLIQRVLGKVALKAGKEATQADIASHVALKDAIGTHREVRMLDRTAFYTSQIADLRFIASEKRAIQSTGSAIPRYGMEAALILGAVGVSVLLLATRDVESAIATLVLFLVASSRILPSLLRLSAAHLAIQSATASARTGFELAASISPEPKSPGEPDVIRLPTRPSEANVNLVGSLDVKAATFRYASSLDPAVHNLTTSLQAGQSLAIVGPSGSGKSTLVELLLGTLAPDSGQVRIGGHSPEFVRRTWPGQIGYVPQDVFLLAGTVRENVALARDPADVVDEQVWRSLERANLADYLTQSRDGLDTVIGEDGLRLSGGQQQRLGLARALYTEPTLIVLDEATSALDATTESEITRTIDQLGGLVTKITVAHRLATVRNADRVIYLKQGRIVAQGSFEEVRDVVPEFSEQARLMGL